VREAYFSDEYYKMLWGKRIGFAKIAIAGKVVSSVSVVMRVVASQKITS